MDKEKKLKKSIENFVAALANYCDIDVNDPNIKDTPDRLFRMYKNELLVGYKNDIDKYVKTFDGVNNFEQPLTIDNIPIKSLCSHHLLPFFGKAKITIKYKKGAKILGLSKFYRIVDYYARRLQLQERLTSEIANYLINNLDVSYVKVETECSHTCVGIRGVNATDNKTISVYELSKEV